jgi:hypothetical protein
MHMGGVVFMRGLRRMEIVMQKTLVALLLAACSLSLFAGCTTTGSAKDPNVARDSRISDRPADRPGRS